MKFIGNVHNGTSNRLLQFGSDPDHRQDPGSFLAIFLITQLISNRGGIVTLRRSTLSLSLF